MSWHKGVCCFTAALWVAVLFLGGTAAAAEEFQEVKAVFVGEDEENGFRYECPGIGGFSANFKPDEDAEFGIITADPGLSWELYCDGVLESQESVELIYENGSYEYRLFSQEEGLESVRGVFKFTVFNEYGSLTEDDASLFSVIEDPDLTVSYDDASSSYIYELPNRSSFSINVPLGAVTAKPVALTLPPASAIYELKRDGEPKLVPETLVFSDPGNYMMLLLSSQSDLSSDETNAYRVPISFAIVPEINREIDIINAPTDFFIRSAVHDGIETASGGETLYLESDGKYHLVFEAKENEKITYETDLIIDRTAPYVKFSDSVYEGMVKPPISYQPSENGAEITVYRNGEKMVQNNNLITNGGNYTVSITDKAGNIRRYNFQVAYKNHLVDWKVIIISIVLLGMAAAWLWYIRRHMRIL